jgi:hypothetical protein
MKQAKNNPTNFILIAMSLFVILFVFILYTFLHEGGHALVGLLYGQSLTEFNISFWDLSAHVGMAGGELTQSQLAIQSIAGAGLPLLIWTIFIIFVPRKTSFIVESLKLISSMVVVNTLLAWIILPILFLLGKAPSDDVTNFLLYSRMSPLLLAMVAILLYAGGWRLFLSKIAGIRNELLMFRTTEIEKVTSGIRTTIPLMASIMGFCVLIVFILNNVAGGNSLKRFTPPQDFEPVTQVDLSTRAYAAETLAQFSLDKPTYVGVFIAIRGINTTYFDLCVTGPDGYNSVVLHGEGYNAFQDGGLWENRLLPGTYQLVLTSHQSPGTASVYIKKR